MFNPQPDATILETQFFMMKYGVFMIAGILGIIASASNNTAYTVKTFIHSLVLTIIFAIIFGILLMNFWDLPLEVCFAIVTILSFFNKKVIIELTEILENASDFVKGFINSKTGNIAVTNQSTDQLTNQSTNSNEEYVDEQK